MDARQLIEDDIKQSIRTGMRLGILFNPRMSGDFFNSRIIISSHYSRFSNEEDFINNYVNQYEADQYLVALQDGSFFQVNYEFEVKKRVSYLKKMNQCYLPSVNDGKITNDYLRLDYNNEKDNSFFHPYAHLHVGFKNTIRIPIDEVMLFSEFLLMVLYYYYPDDFKAIVGNEKKYGNTIQENGMGKMTKDKVLSLELEKYMYLKTAL